MKKLIGLCLSLVLMASFPISAFSADSVSEPHLDINNIISPTGMIISVSNKLNDEQAYKLTEYYTNVDSGVAKDSSDLGAKIFLECDGSKLSDKETYWSNKLGHKVKFHKLRRLLKSKGCFTDADGNILLPDLRNMFLRGYKQGTTNYYGTKQEDYIQDEIGRKVYEWQKNNGQRDADGNVTGGLSYPKIGFLSADSNVTMEGSNFKDVGSSVQTVSGEQVNSNRYSADTLVAGTLAAGGSAIAIGTLTCPGIGTAIAAGYALTNATMNLLDLIPGFLSRTKTYNIGNICTYASASNFNEDKNIEASNNEVVKTAKNYMAECENQRAAAKSSGGTTNESAGLRQFLIDNGMNYCWRSGYGGTDPNDDYAHNYDEWQGVVSAISNFIGKNLKQETRPQNLSAYYYILAR